MRPAAAVLSPQEQQEAKAAGEYLAKGLRARADECLFPMEKGTHDDFENYHPATKRLTFTMRVVARSAVS